MKDVSKSLESRAADSRSPFHLGEREIQEKLGVREQMERFGRKVIRDYMPEQHRAFYQQLPFVFVGHADRDGNPWASILFDQNKLMSSPDDKTLNFHAKPVAGDPLEASWKAGTELGLLGIELPTRRRNRLSATLAEKSDALVRLKVKQSFGNCPQYIQSRRLHWLDPQSLPAPSVDSFTQLNAEARRLINESDTFFVASYIASDTGESSEGADVSHRGGRPGFVRVDDAGTLTIPDYLGNNHFNTFGNFAINNRAGLLFLDFENGHILTLTGRAEVLWDSDDLVHFEGAERLWRFELTKGHLIKHALPMRWELENFSPNSLLTGTWQEAHKAKESEQLKQDWLAYKVTAKIKESDVITSFRLAPVSHGKFPFQPGQFLTFKARVNGKEMIRTYTVSNAPYEKEYRISVKRETARDGSAPDGVFSTYLHDQIHVGDELLARAPNGSFVYNASEDKPAVLLAGGVGITPMISMAKHTLSEGIRTRSMRSVTVFAAARNHQERAFHKELLDLERASGGQIKTYWSLGEVDNTLTPGKDYHHVGRISPQLLQSVLAIDDYEFYLCGPPGFMQHGYDLLLKLGVSDHRISAEEFGPASLQRKQQDITPVFHREAIASEAVVKFEESGFEQAWQSSDGSLLEFAEAHGLSPDFACRSGQCGACKVPLVSGKVAYESECAFPVADNEVLLCCAKPAKGTEAETIALGL